MLCSMATFGTVVVVLVCTGLVVDGDLVARVVVVAIAASVVVVIVAVSGGVAPAIVVFKLALP